MRIFLAIAIVIGGCKPSEEPDRRPAAVLEVAGGAAGDGPGALRVTERVAAAEPTAPPVVGRVDAAAAAEDGRSPEDATPDDATPDDATPEVGAELPDSVAETAAGPEVIAAVAAGTFEGGLDDGLRAALSAPPRDGARDEARRLNKLGLEQHKKKALDAAIEQYQAALAAYPGFPFARYNLACALALKGQDEAALFQLAALAWLANERADQTSRDRLAAARIDPDFERLRDDARFRELTGATVILVAWAASDEARAEARRLVKVLRDARWPARVGTSGWPSPLGASGVRVVADDPIAERASRAVVELLRATTSDPWPIEIGAELPPNAPPIVVLVQPAAPVETTDTTAPPSEATAPPSEDERAPAAEPPPEDTAEDTAKPTPDDRGAGGRLMTLADALGRALRAERTTAAGAERHRLELKPTGFFTWDLTLPDGSKRHRAGRWSGNNRQLTLTFKETSEGPEGSPPTVLEDQRLELPVALGDALGLGELRFR